MRCYIYYWIDGESVNHCVSNISERQILSSPDERRRPADNKPTSPFNFRRFMGWAFLASSPRFAITSIESVWYAAHHGYYPIPPFRNLLYSPPFSTVAVVVFGVAWWTIWKGKSSARPWGIAASVVCIMTFVRQFIVPTPHQLGDYAGWLFVGIVGLVAFFWPTRQMIS